ncbi:MAG: hypothetical protein GX287_04815 [Fusobacteria bacterium]|nr:hypothetical protein [Fusobacteriota bacterium]
MKKNILLLFIMFSTVIFSRPFENIEILEKKIFGFTLESNGNYYDRLEILEKKIFGKTSSEQDVIRIEKIKHFIYLDSDYYAPIRKIENIEENLFENLSNNIDIITRVDKIEEKLFSKIENSKPLMERIDICFDYLMLKNDNFKEKQLIKNTIEKLVIKGEKLKKTKKNKEVTFIVTKGYKNIVKKGDIIRGKVIKVENVIRFKNRKIDVSLYEIKNSYGDIIKIEKTIETRENDVNKEIIIEDIPIIKELNNE